MFANQNIVRGLAVAGLGLLVAGSGLAACDTETTAAPTVDSVAPNNDATDGGASDTEAPTVKSTLPADKATGTAITAAIKVTFSEAMDPSAIGPSSFTLSDGTASVAGNVVAAGTTATMTPTFTHSETALGTFTASPTAPGT